MVRVLVLGGYGVFGRRAAERLARHAGIEVVLAGRNEASARLAAEGLSREVNAAVAYARLDALSLTSGDLARLGVSTVINTVGPYQAHDYRVAEAAIAAGAHYIDLADARAFVTGITALDERARKAGVLVVSGASSVPALAAAVIDDLAPRFNRLEALTYGISPGNSFDPGIATTASILGNVGRPFKTLIDGRQTMVYGWQPLRRHRFRSAAGTRWLGACDVPDLDLFPLRYPALRSQHFVAGVEVKVFHLGLYAVSWLVRFGLLRQPERLAGPLLRLKQKLSFLGSNRGAMFVTAAGVDQNGRALTVTWELIAARGHGPFIPATPAVILAKRLASGSLAQRGAVPCLGFVTLADFTAEVADLDIHQSLA